MTIQLRLLASAGLDPPSPPSYRHLVSEKIDSEQIRKDVLTAVQVFICLDIIISGKILY